MLVKVRFFLLPVGYCDTIIPGGMTMKDLPMFTTEYGVASLVLREIPYRQEAYIRIVTTEQPCELIEECAAFCRACGAEKVYATGHEVLEQYPLHTAVWLMRGSREELPPTDAALWPVLPENVDTWRSIYNERMSVVANASYMTAADATVMLESGDGYFIHRDETMLGIGKASGGMIEAVVSVCPGSGADIMGALAGVLTEDTITLEVASTNEKAIRLYERLGFIRTGERSRWYRIK